MASESEQSVQNLWAEFTPVQNEDISVRKEHVPDAQSSIDDATKIKTGRGDLD